MPNYSMNNPWVPSYPGSSSTATTTYNPNYVTYTTPTANPNSIIWVQGEQAARSYPVAPGNQLMLFDSEDSVFYIKKADSTGRPLPLEVYDFHRREPETSLPEELTVKYATSDDVRKIIKEELDSFRKSQYKQIKAKEVSTNA